MFTARLHPSEREAVRAGIRAQALISLPYVAMNAMAAGIASYGLLADSAAVVIGAMIVALLLGPIIGVALAIADNDRLLLVRASAALLLGAMVVYGTALVIGLVHRDLPLTHEILARTSPTILDLMIALVGGAAGAYATVSPRLGLAVVGVAVATALVPPLSASALLVARGEFHLGWRALLLASTNIVAIQFASSVVLLLTGFRDRAGGSAGVWGWFERNALTLVALVALGAVLSVNLRDVVEEQLYQGDVRSTLADQIVERHPLAYITEVRFDTDHATGRLVIRAVVRTVDDIGADEVAQLEQMLPRPPSGRDFELRIREVRIEVITRTGPLVETEDGVP